MKTKVTACLGAFVIYVGGSAGGDEVSLATAPPVVVRTVPVAGSTDVDPALTEIRVTYSKTMQDGSWSWSTWGEENFPKTTGAPRYLDDKRTCVLPVKLEPEKFYATWLNSENFGNFKDADGRSAVPYLLTFRTGKTAGGISSELDAKIAQLAKAGTPVEEAIRLLGKPIEYRWGNETFAKDKLPATYILRYDKGVAVVVNAGQVTELRAEGVGPGFSYHGQLRLGSSLEDMLRVVGEPSTTVTGQPLKFEPGVLYKDIDGEKGRAYYARPNKQIRCFLLKNKIVALYMPLRGEPAVGTGEQGTADTERMKSLVEDFFAHNFRDITSRETIEWGEPIPGDNGNASIRYKYRAKIWDRDTVTNNQVFTFSSQGKFVSVKDAAVPAKAPIGSAPEGKSVERTIDKAISEFPSTEDLSTPETACAAWQRASARKDGNALNRLSIIQIDPAQQTEWYKREEKRDAESLAIYLKALAESKIVKVQIWRDEVANVITFLPFPEGKGRHPYSARTFGLVNGAWRNMGEDRLPDAESAAANFENRKERLWEHFNQLKAKAASDTGPRRAERDSASLLNDNQRAVLAWTDRQFRSFFDERKFEGWSDEERTNLEKKLIDALSGPRSTEYYQAINTLAALRSTNALPRLREIAFERVDRNNRDRWMCIRALGIIGDKSSVPDLIHLVYHGNVNTRWWAQISLVRLTGQNFGKDWNAWGKWWNERKGQPPFKPEIIRWWSGQPEPDKLAESLEESDRKFLESVSAKQTDSQSNRPATFSAEMAAAAFDQLWEAFDREYAMFALRPEVDWKKLREQYRPKALEAKSAKEFAEVCAEMLKPLRDLHVWMTVEGANVPIFNRPRAGNSNPSAHRAILGDLRPAGRVRWAITADRIGFVAIDGWNSGPEIPAQVDEALEQMRDGRGLIVDVRLNGGGDEPTAAQVAGRFVPKEFVYSYSQFRNGPKHTDLTAKHKRKISPRGPWRYDRPVVLLIGQKCMSSNESFIAMMSGAPNVAVMGDRTCGSSGNPKIVKLPLDITVSVPRWIDYLPDGKPLDERGFQPQVFFKPTERAFEGNRDDLLTAALERLRASAANL